MPKKVQTKSTQPTTESEFKTAERYWKSRLSSPDLSLALTTSNIIWEDSSSNSIGWWLNKATGIKLECRKVKLRDILLGEGMGCKSWKGKGKQEDGNEEEEEFCVIIPCMPGLVLLPSILSPSIQRSLTVESLHCALLPNLTSLSAHYNLPETGLWNTYAAGGGDLELERIDTDLESKKAAEGPRMKVDFEPITRDNWEKTGGRVAVENVEKVNYVIPSGKAEKLKPAEAEGVVVEAKSTIKDLLKKLRWTTIGWSYDWSSKTYDFSRGKTPLPPLIFSLCRDAVRSVPFVDVFGTSATEEEKSSYEKWIDYEPQAGVVNYYQMKDSLTAHIDQSEVDAVLPLISFSVGHSAVFLIGGQTRETPPLAIILASGDGLIMSGKGRRLFHGLPRVIPDSLPAYLKSDSIDEKDEEPWKLFGEYLEGGARLNINIRTVF